MNLQSASADTGIVFRRVDLEGTPRIEAKVENVIDSRLATTLGVNGVRIGVVEHLLAAAAGLGIDNLIVDLDGPEVPIMDGSAAPHLVLLKSAGVKSLDEPRRVVRINKTIRVEEDGKMLEIRPSDEAWVSCSIEFEHPLLESQTLDGPLDVTFFDREISRARTFGFAKDVNLLQKNGMIKGGSLDCAIVIDDYKVVNPTGLRFEDEFVRHKVLDLVGDLSLMGRPIIGHVVAHKTGHALNHSLVRALKCSPGAWETVTLTADTAPQVEGPAVPQLAGMPEAAIA